MNFEEAKDLFDGKTVEFKYDRFVFDNTVLRFYKDVVEGRQGKKIVFRISEAEFLKTVMNVNVVIKKEEEDG